MVQRLRTFIYLYRDWRAVIQPWRRVGLPWNHLFAGSMGRESTVTGYGYPGISSRRGGSCFIRCRRISWRTAVARYSITGDYSGTAGIWDNALRHAWCDLLFARREGLLSDTACCRSFHGSAPKYRHGRMDSSQARPSGCDQLFRTSRDVGVKQRHNLFLHEQRTRVEPRGSDVSEY